MLPDQVANFAGIRFLQAAAFAFEFLGGFDEGLSHPSMGLFGTTHDGKFFRTGKTLVTVRLVQGNPEEMGHLGSLLGRGTSFLDAVHDGELKPGAGKRKWFREKSLRERA